MTEIGKSLVSRSLASRVASEAALRPVVDFKSDPVPTGLVESLRDRLAAGETHYTARPGIPELRSAIGQALGVCGGPTRDADGVIITHGEGEAFYVTLLGLGMNAQTPIQVLGDCRHRKLLDLLGIGVIERDDATAPVRYRELGKDALATADSAGDAVDIVLLGSFLYSTAAAPGTLDVSAKAILIGNLDALSAVDHFRLGFVAGPPELVKRIQTWKQALSICTAGPSQRAALFAIAKESRS